MICFLQFFFIKWSSNLFAIKDINNIYPWLGIFNFFNHKNLFRPIWSVTFYKNIPGAEENFTRSNSWIFKHIFQKFSKTAKSNVSLLRYRSWHSPIFLFQNSFCMHIICICNIFNIYVAIKFFFFTQWCFIKLFLIIHVLIRINTFSWQENTMCCTSIFTCIMAMISNFLIIYTFRDLL